MERQAGLPAGTTSSYFRTRSALLHATAKRVAELDAADLEAVTRQRPKSELATPVTTLSLLAEMAMRSATGPGLDRSRARYEIALHAQRDAVLRRAVEDAIEGFVGLSEQAVIQVQPDGAVDRALVTEQAYAVTTFLNGVIVRQVIGDRKVASAEELTRQLHALVAGIAASHHVHVGQV